VIEKLAYDWATVEKAFILSGYGLRYHNSNETYRMFMLLGILTGKYGRPGAGVIEGLQLQGWPMSFNEKGIMLPDTPTLEAKGV
jgi:anaerobic selenocysteine-containing dehydrogenase